jgi:pimeloyl-ACP methyl ester carboxylesterase
MPRIGVRTEKDLIDIMKRAEEAIDYDPNSAPPPQYTSEAQQVAPPVYSGDDFDSYARIAKQAYSSDRENLSTHNYVAELSSSDYAVYESPDEYVVGIRGSSGDTSARDLFRDTQVGLGSIGPGLVGAALAGVPGAIFGTTMASILKSQGEPYGISIASAVDDVREIVDNIKARNTQKKIHITGHSLGGTIAQKFGINSPDINVTTFNAGSGIPFLDDELRCAITGCSNISNKRISGDFASVLGQKSFVGKSETMVPVRSTQEEIDQAKLLQGFFIDEDLYLPHSIGQFIGRPGKHKLDTNLYARKLAAKTGKLVGIAAPFIAKGAANVASGFLSARELQSRVALLPEWNIANLQDLRSMARDLGISPEGPRNQRMSWINALARTGRVPFNDVELGEIRLRDARNELTELLGNRARNVAGRIASQGPVSAVSSFLGASVGEMAAVAAYDIFN